MNNIAIQIPSSDLPSFAGLAGSFATSEQADFSSWIWLSADKLSNIVWGSGILEILNLRNKETNAWLIPDHLRDFSNNASQSSGIVTMSPDIGSLTYVAPIVPIAISKPLPIDTTTRRRVSRADAAKIAQAISDEIQDREYKARMLEATYWQAISIET